MGSSETETTDRLVSEKLALIRRRRAWMNGVLLMSIPLGFLSGALAALIGEISPLWLVLLVAAWLAVCAVFIARVALARCPFCDQRFFGRAPFPHLWSRRCRNCSVPLSG
jgi:hypothetical protein